MPVTQPRKARWPESADISLHASSGGFAIACENIYRAAGPLVQDIVAHWDQWKMGVPP